MLLKPLSLTLPGLLIATSIAFAQSKIESEVKTELHVERMDNRTVNVTVGNEPFVTYNFGHDEPKPFLHPVIGPGKLRMTRDFPMKKTMGEANDHPHHRSMWIGHEINGVDFWTCRGGATIVVQGGSVGDNFIQMSSQWIDADAKAVCSDSTTWTFGFDNKSRWIDCEFKLNASEGPITINDTKEGTVAIRTHPDLRLKPDPKRGVEKVFGNAINSQGTEGKEVWGQSASWVLYTGEIEKNAASILILDKPDNFRHATTWHARDYGLIAANPFGLHDFQGMEKGSGEVKLAKGQSLTLRYRFMFFAEKIDFETAETLHANYAAERTQPTKPTVQQENQETKP